jgi:hypothetical protein
MTFRRVVFLGAVVFGVVACGGAGAADPAGPPGESGSGGSGGSGTAGSGTAGSGIAGSVGLGGGGVGGEGGSIGVGGQQGGDPNTCEGAAALKSYVGCDYWPTVVANAAWDIFDYAVIVANAGDSPAEITVTRGNQQVATVKVAPNSLEKIYLPWVSELKGGQADNCGSPPPLTKTVGVLSGAYHLVSTRPVTVYQFNALQYKGAGGPPGKSWASCPGNTTCFSALQPLGCFSFSNDASLLLPSTALTGNYRVTMPAGQPNPISGGNGAYFTITGTQDGTSVKVQLSPSGAIRAGAGIPATSAGGIFSFVLNKGDVVQVLSDPNTDPAGSLVQASKPVQVIGGISCANIPDTNTQACDHLEETVLPAETLGKRYLVAPPTGPKGNTPGHVVRMVGNVDGTKLTYKGQAPAGAPATINAGQVVKLGLVKGAFEVEGDHEFIVSTFMPGAMLLDPDASQEAKGDPSMSTATAVEQFRKKYVFLAPDDYDISYADVLAPEGTSLTLDGQPVTTASSPIQGTGYVVFRIKLGPGQGGAHQLEADKEVGLQVMGYGSYTSYQYPGGSNLTLIAPPPPDIN